MKMFDDKVWRQMKMFDDKKMFDDDKKIDVGVKVDLYRVRCADSNGAKLETWIRRKGRLFGHFQFVDSTNSIFRHFPFTFSGRICDRSIQLVEMHRIEVIRSAEVVPVKSY
jgi:hypothetical protein